MGQKSIKDFILDEYGKGNIVFNTIEGGCIVKLDKFLSQPAEGMLYDLNRDSATILTFINDQKWVNDFALSKVVVELKKRLDEANERIKGYEDRDGCNKTI